MVVLLTDPVDTHANQDDPIVRLDRLLERVLIQIQIFESRNLAFDVTENKTQRSPLKKYICTEPAGLL